MFAAIVSVNNARIKNAAQLKESRARRKSGKFLVDGVREVHRAASSQFELLEVYWNAGDRIEADERVDFHRFFAEKQRRERHDAELLALLQNLEERKIPVFPVSSAVFEKLSFGDRDERIVAVVRARLSTFESLDVILNERRRRNGENPLVAVLEKVEKPGNFGAVLRSADGAGVDAVVVASDDFDVFNPNAVRASLGAIFHMPIIMASVEETILWLRGKRLQRVLALCDDSVPYTQVDYALPTAIVLGSEADGLTDAWLEETTDDVEGRLLQKVRLPMLGVVDSLNVSNAAAVFFYEARRRRIENSK